MITVLNMRAKNKKFGDATQWRYYTAKKIGAAEYLLTWSDASSTVNEKVISQICLAGKEYTK